MKRRDILRTTISILPGIVACNLRGAGDATATDSRYANLSRPAEFWHDLSQQLGERLKPVPWPIGFFNVDPHGAECERFFNNVANPYFLADHPALTQTFGWVGAWTMKPSEMVVEAETAADIAAAINFAREKRVRLVVKGGGHSYKGCSNAEGSLLIWTHRMRQVNLHDNFVPLGSSKTPVHAVSVGAGAIWGEVYKAVCVEGGRYVQGGGCLTVGVAGLVQSGGFGSFSKRYGLAAASLVEAEVVTADGEVRVVNAEREPELFFALKGGGGGTFGVVTRMTMETHQLPPAFGAVSMEIRAATEEAYRLLIREMLGFYRGDLHNAHWGEQIRIRPDNVLVISMMFQGLSQREAEEVWAPFVEWVRSRPQDFKITVEPVIISVPARSLWDPKFLKTLPGVVLDDDQPGAEPDRIFRASNREEAGQVIHAYRSGWLASALLKEANLQKLADALVAASRHWSVSLHANKGLAGSSQEVLSKCRDTAINPVALEAFALVICAAEGPPAYPGIEGHEPDIAQAHRDAGRIDAAMSALMSLVPVDGAYLAESDYHQKNWQASFWGSNRARLKQIKGNCDPGGLFTVHHGVGSGER
jgi:FAD/FMN-containing dehydrogenase